ncbi:MAG TPA: VWA domain-containing protein [Gemmatimonadaceae bacterium]
MHFADPRLLWLLALVPLYLWARWPRRRRPPRDRLGYSALPLLGGAPASARTRWAPLPTALRALALALGVVALARPRANGEVTDIELRGRNVMLALDISSSMKALDFQAGNRLDAAKRVLGDFVRARAGDFLGLVLFAGRVFTQAPLTNDREALQELLARADIGMLPDGTAIGTALAVSESRLKDLPHGSGVIVLVTDGGNNTGAPDPLTAAAAARALGIRIYAVGVSARAAAAPSLSSRPATMEAPTPLSTRDETLLRRIAEVSGGAYFRATDRDGLARALREIDAREKTPLHLREVRSQRELFAWLAGPALLLLVAELALDATWLRRVP